MGEWKPTISDVASFAWLQVWGEICYTLAWRLPIGKSGTRWRSLMLWMWGHAYAAGAFTSLRDWSQCRTSAKSPPPPSTEGGEDE